MGYAFKNIFGLIFLKVFENQLIEYLTKINDNYGISTIFSIKYFIIFFDQIKAGSNPNVTEVTKGYTPLMIAAQENYEGVVKYLVHFGAGVMNYTVQGFIKNKINMFVIKKMFHTQQYWEKTFIQWLPNMVMREFCDS